MAEQERPYVVLLGGAGSGKSTIVEKVTGEKRASGNARSATKESKPLWSLKGEFIISDTPGSNAVGDKFNHNIWIATAFNFRPVSKILIVVKADIGRIDGVIEAIREYSDRFVDLPDVPLGVVLTHMDKIEWDASENGYEADFKEVIIDEAGIDDVLFACTSTNGPTLIENISKMCNTSYNLRVNHDNFLRLFTKLHKMRPTDILSKCQQEVDEFKKKREAFEIERKQFRNLELVDLVFEFQSFMTKEITRAKIRVSDQFNFTFDGTEADNEAAHMSNMSNQMIVELRGIRIEALDSQSGHGVGGRGLRKCPHCGQVWTKVEGCDGETICGERPNNPNDTRGRKTPSFHLGLNFEPQIAPTVMATFTFAWDESTKKLGITKSGTKGVMKGREGRGHGCRNHIVWSEMAPVQVPVEFNPTVAAVAMTDIDILPPQAANFNDRIDQRLEQHLGNMTLGDRP